jgi:hypothetical protein
MKGSLHTDELMGAVVKRETGLAHVPPHQPLLHHGRPGSPRAADRHRCGGSTSRPTLKDKVDIVQNAIDLARDLGATEVRVAILSAMETVNPDVPSTLEAARAVQDGRPRADHRRAARRPALPLDNAISPEAGEDQEDRLAGGRPGQRAGGSGPRGGQHARQEPDLPRRRRRRGHRARGEGADHPHQPRRLADRPLASCAVATLVARPAVHAPRER